MSENVGWKIVFQSLHFNSLLLVRGVLLQSSPWTGLLDCVLGQDTILTVTLSTQVYKWLPENFMLGVTLRWTSIPSQVE